MNCPLGSDKLKMADERENLDDDDNDDLDASSNIIFDSFYDYKGDRINDLINFTAPSSWERVF